MLNTLKPVVTSRRLKRVGRGYGSGKGGHTSSRGTKGARSRVGQAIPLWFEGGQLPLVRRLPFLRGKFKNKTLHKETVLISLAQLEKLGEKTVSRKTLVEHKIISKETDRVKIIGNAKLQVAVSVEGIPVTAGAKALIEKAGGKVA